MKLTAAQQRQLVREFQRTILWLDHGRCRNPNCIGTQWERGILSAHHIKFKSYGVDHSAENGILLCQGCDHAVHHGHGKGDERLSAREFMLQILNDLVDDPEYRWRAAHQVLRDRYETNDERNMMAEQTTEAKRADSDLFAVYALEDGTLVIDSPSPQTGELLPTAVGSLPIPKRLTGLAFAIRNQELHRDQQMAILKDQIATIRMHMAAVTERTDIAVGVLKSMGTMLLNQLHDQGLAATDAKHRPRLPIAGCGAWVTNTKAAGYKTDDWDQMDKDARATASLEHKSLFSVEQVPAHSIVKPIRTKIIAALKAGAVVDGFELIEATDAVQFKIEKGTGIPPVGVVETDDKAGD